jgi:hypothetical protein
MPTEIQDGTASSSKPPNSESADLLSSDAQSTGTLQWVAGSLHRTGCRLYGLLPSLPGSSWGPKREISEFGEKLHKKYIELEKRDFIEIDPSHKIASAVMMEFLSQFESRELELQAKGQKAIDPAPRQIQLLMSAYVLIAPRNRWNKPEWRGWSLVEHEQLQDLFHSDH